MSYKTSTKEAIAKRIRDTMDERGYSFKKFYDLVLDQLYVDYPEEIIDLSYEAFRKQLYGTNNPSRPEYYISIAKVLNVSMDYLFTGNTEGIIKDSFQAEPTAKGVFRAVAYIYRALSKDSLVCQHSFIEHIADSDDSYDQDWMMRFISLEFRSYYLRDLLSKLYNLDVSDYKTYSGRTNAYDDIAILSAENKVLRDGKIYDYTNANSMGGLIDMDERDVKLDLTEEREWDIFDY